MLSTTTVALAFLFGVIFVLANILALISAEHHDRGPDPSSPRVKGTMVAPPAGRLSDQGRLVGGFTSARRATEPKPAVGKVRRISA